MADIIAFGVASRLTELLYPTAHVVWSVGIDGPIISDLCKSHQKAWTLRRDGEGLYLVVTPLGSKP